MITASMNDYSGAITGTSTLPVTVALPCDSGPIIGPASLLGLPSIILDTFSSEKVIENLHYSSMVTKQHFEDCIPVISWYQYRNGSPDSTALDPTVFTTSFSNDLA